MTTKEISYELKSINEAVQGIHDDYRGLGLKYREAKAAMDDQAKAIKALEDAVTGIEIKAQKDGLYHTVNIYQNPEVKGMFDWIQGKAATVNVGPSGGYLVHTDYLDYVLTKVRDVDEIRANASVYTTSTSALELPVEDGDAALEWVGETQERSETTMPTIGKVSIEVCDCSAIIQISRKLRQDASFNLDQYFTERLIDRISRGEGEAFVNGSGNGVPEGLWACNRIDSIGVETVGSLSGDDMIDATAEVPWALESQCKYILNKRTEVALRKLKDTDGQYLWQPALASGMPTTFAGYQIVKAPSAPDIGDCPVIFGALKDYAIVDRAGVEMIMDETSQSLRTKGLVEYQFGLRVGAAVTNPESFVKIDTTQEA